MIDVRRSSDGDGVAIISLIARTQTPQPFNSLNTQAKFEERGQVGSAAWRSVLGIGGLGSAWGDESTPLLWCFVKSGRRLFGFIYILRVVYFCRRRQCASSDPFADW